MKYEVISLFHDGQDGRYEYHKGDIYPRKNYKPSEARIKELSTTKNKLGKVLIKAIETTKEDKAIEPEVEVPEKVEAVEKAEKRPRKTTKKAKSKK